MKLAAVIAEYNPFHNGHAHHIRKTRECGATHVVAVMSGNVVQRGDFALVDKFSRAGAAVECGADLVLELPAAYACAPANRFADGAVDLIEKLGCVDILSFGCESGDAQLVAEAARVTEDDAVVAQARAALKNGAKYPAALAEAAGAASPSLRGILLDPNSVLAAEYIKALSRRGSAIQPLAVKRLGASHDGAPSGDFASASHIRRLAIEKKEFSRYLPACMLDRIVSCMAAGRLSGGIKEIETAVLYRLRTMTDAEIAAIPDGSDGLANRIHSAAFSAAGLEQLYADASAKRYTAARVRRAVLAAVLGITQADYRGVPYARVLACGEGGKDILRAADSSLAVSSSLKKLENLGGQAERCALLEQRVSAVFALTCADKTDNRGELTAKFGVAGE